MRSLHWPLARAACGQAPASLCRPGLGLLMTISALDSAGTAACVPVSWGACRGRGRCRFLGEMFRAVRWHRSAGRLLVCFI